VNDPYHPMVHIKYIQRQVRKYLQEEHGGRVSNKNLMNLIPLKPSTSRGLPMQDCQRNHVNHGVNGFLNHHNPVKLTDKRLLLQQISHPSELADM